MDCHPGAEIMGDGTTPAHSNEATRIPCEACHGAADGSGGALSTRPWSTFTDPVSLAAARLAGGGPSPGAEVPVGRGDLPLWNLLPTGDPVKPWALRARTDGALHPIPPTPDDPDHRLPGHARLACSTCHAAGIPWCADCHTSHDPQGTQWDFGLAAVAPGAWRESARTFDWLPPALGVLGDRVVPTTPGMILDLDLPDHAPAGGRRSVRLHAPLEPHSTRREARTCADCHASARVLGLGSRTLDLAPPGARVSGADPTVPAPDAWTALAAATPGVGTRRDLRSFDADELARVLRVGHCVECHGTAADPAWAGGTTRSCRISRESGLQ